MTYIDYDPLEFDEHVDSLHPTKSMVSVKKAKSKGVLAQRVISEAQLSRSSSNHDNSVFNSEDNESVTE